MVQLVGLLCALVAVQLGFCPVAAQLAASGSPPPTGALTLAGNNPYTYMLEALSYADQLRAPNYTSSSAATNATGLNIASALGGRVLRVAASAYSLTAPIWAVDAFIQIVPNGNLTAAYAALQPGQAIRVERNDVDGVIPALFDQVCLRGGCTVEWWWPKLPSKLDASTDNSLKFLYLLNDLGMDAVANAATITAQRRQYMRLTTSYQSYSYQVVAPIAVLPKLSINAVLWTWLSPFTPGLWAVLLGSLFLSGVIIFLLEAHTRLKKNDFSELVGTRVKYPLRSAFSQSIFLASMAAAGNPRIAPTTTPSRIFVFAKSFSIYIVMASYLANFAAKLATVPTPIQLVTGFDAFTTLGKPMCIRNSATYVSFASIVYPGIKTVLAGPATVDVLNGIANGTCVGGMLNEVELRYAFGPGDPTGTLYCGLEYVGQQSVATFQFAIPFTADTTRLSNAAFNAINQALDLYLYSGNYTINTAAKYLAVRDKSKCAPYLRQFQAKLDNGGVPPPLTVTDLAGVFIFMTATGVVCLLIATVRDKHRTLETLAGCIWPKAQQEEEPPRDAETAMTTELAELAAAAAEGDKTNAPVDSHEVQHDDRPGDEAELALTALRKQLAEKDAMLHLLLRRLLSAEDNN